MSLSAGAGAEPPGHHLRFKGLQTVPHCGTDFQPSSKRTAPQPIVFNPRASFRRRSGSPCRRWPAALEQGLRKGTVLFAVLERDLREIPPRVYVGVLAAAFRCSASGDFHLRKPGSPHAATPSEIGARLQRVSLPFSSPLVPCASLALKASRAGAPGLFK